MQYKIWILSAAIVAGLSAQAHSQERFDGAYAGLSLGVGRMTSEADGLKAKKNGPMLGIYGGYTSVQPGGFAWGGELSLSGLTGEGNVRDGARKGKQKNGALLSAKARVGYAMERSFFYGIAGVSTTNGGLRKRGGKNKEMVVGPMFGLGAEFALSDDWSARVEATRHKLGGKEYDFGSGKDKVSQHVDQISFGLSRQF